MELTGNPLWRIYYSGSDLPRIETFLSEAQKVVTEHDIKSITFCVNVMLTDPGIGGKERDFNEREMTKEELLSLTPQWLEEEMKEAARTASKHWGLVDNPS